MNSISYFFSFPKLINFLILGSLIIFPLNHVFANTPQLYQTQIGKALKEAERLYLGGYFDEAIQILDDFIESFKTNEQERAEAYKLLGKAYAAKRLLDEAKASLRKMLELDPNIRFDPKIEPPSVYRLYQEIKDQMDIEKTPEVPPILPEPGDSLELPSPQKSKGGIPLWLKIAGGSAVAIGAAAIIIGSGGPDIQVASDNLPDPPTRPPGN